MLVWIIVILVIFVVLSLITLWVLLKNRQELRYLRRAARDHTSTLLRINSLANRTHVAVILQGLEQRYPVEGPGPEVAESPSGQWPSLETVLLESAV